MGEMRLNIRRRSGVRLVLAAGILAALAGCSARATPLAIGDAQTGVRVKTALVNDPILGVLPIAVRVRGRVVTLSGVVPTASAIDDALALAGAVTGVVRVESALEIGVSSPTSQTRGRPRLPALAPRPDTTARVRFVGVGASLNLARPSDGALTNRTAVGPLLRLRPRHGLGPTVGFSWTRSALGGSGDASSLARLRVRPVMLGAEYGQVRGRLSAGASIVAGYAFNSLDIDATRAGPDRAIAVGNSFAWRPGLSVWYDIAPRLGVNVFVGRVFTRPEVTFASDSAVASRRVRADSTVINVGVAYWVF